MVTTETPADATRPDEYEYPFPDDENRQIYRRYRACAAALDRVLICGRLGEYRYYDMDQAIGRALHLARRVLRDRQDAPLPRRLHDRAAATADPRPAE